IRLASCATDRQRRAIALLLGALALLAAILVLAPVCPSQQNLVQDRESSHSATAAPIITATSAEHKQQHDDQQDQFKSTHDRISFGRKIGQLRPVHNTGTVQIRGLPGNKIASLEKG